MNLDFIPVGNYSWIPIVAFLLVIFSNGIIGFFLGWKAMLYFFLGNMLFIIIGVFLYIPIYGLISKNIVSKYTVTDNNITNLLNEARGYWGAMFLFFWLLIINIILGVVYIFIRKYLKVKQDKFSKLKTINLKLAGASLGTLSGVLAAIPVMGFSTMVFSPLNVEGEKSNLDSFSDWTLKVISFGQMYETQNAQRMVKFFKLMNDKQSSMYVLGDLISDSSVLTKDIQKSIDSWNKGRNDLQMIFGDSDLTAAMIKLVPNFNVKKNIKIGKEYSIYVNKFLKITVSKFQPLKLNQETQKIFKGLFSTVFKVEDGKGKKLEKESNVISDYFASHLFGDGSYKLPVIPKP